MGGQSGRVDLDHGTSPPSVCLGRLSLGGAARFRPGPKVTHRPGPWAAERCDGARAWSMDQRPGRTWRRPLATGLRPAEAEGMRSDSPCMTAERTEEVKRRPRPGPGWRRRDPDERKLHALAGAQEARRAGRGQRNTARRILAVATG